MTVDDPTTGPLPDDTDAVGGTDAPGAGEQTATRPAPAITDDPLWWRSAVVYQIYPRSFADSGDDGTGDVRGMIERLPHLASLGVDAVWISPWYPSPLADGGYDVADYTGIHPDFGTLADADEFVAAAHALGIRVLIDLVPNHCSDQHPLFQAALAAGPGSPERDLFVFRDGRGPDGSEPPTNWPAVFGGSAWERVTEPDGTPGQWYLHLFAPEQPDWNWEHPEVFRFFESVLRFWFDRGIDGFRIDVADSMKVDQEFPDLPIDPGTGLATLEKFPGGPVFDRPDLDEIHRHWRAVADEYAAAGKGTKVFVSEAYLTPAERLVRYVRPGQLQTTFNFDALLCEWTAESQRHVIDLTVAAHEAVGAPPTWVLSNHDVTRVATRYGKPRTGCRFTAEGMHPDDLRLGPADLVDLPTDIELGRRRARAAALLELALPGGAYVYQGDELGLPEVEDLPEEVLQDPTWLRSGHTVRGRDGCRVPIPWSGGRPPYGFGTGTPWLPQPTDWAPLTVEAQDGVPGSHLELYRAALQIRHQHPALGDGTLQWRDSGPEVLHFSRGQGFECLVNFGPEPVELPAGAEVLVASGDVTGGVLTQDVAVWLSV
ncbi:glycoside hydrolase family 13 protein [Desertihabitans aurantiacus]|uniref:glycoside hydrolase family 13 protein n=1 Tax=Desertihabitans aurantiacus TaxID=2282477 RepID=UPI000DF7C82C|nr:glycoside hydrolase family 13 protein [Desertihabitans aurantiacus]